MNKKSTTPWEIGEIFLTVFYKLWIAFAFTTKDQLSRYHNLGNLTRTTMSLEQYPFTLYSSINLEKMILAYIYSQAAPLWETRSAVRTSSCDLPFCRLHPDTRKSMNHKPHALHSYSEVCLLSKWDIFWREKHLLLEEMSMRVVQRSLFRLPCRIAERRP